MGPFLAHTRAVAVGWRQPVAWIALAGWVSGPPVWLTPSLFAALAVAGLGAGWASTVFRMPR